MFSIARLWKSWKRTRYKLPDFCIYSVPQYGRVTKIFTFMNEWIWLVHNQNCQIFLWVFNHRFITENKNTGCYGVSHIMLVSRTKSPYGSEVRDENWQWVIVLASCANKCKLKGISVFCKSGEILLKNQVFHENNLQKICNQNQEAQRIHISI